MPSGYDGEFGPAIKALAIKLYFDSNMTERNILDLFQDAEINISAGQLSNFLIKDQGLFHQEKDALYEAGLKSSPWQHIDDTSDKLYFEPLTREDVLNIVEQERPEGIIVQFGGQTPLNISTPLAEAGITILGTSPESIDRAEDRDHFQSLLKKLNIEQPENGIAVNKEGAILIADKIGYPVLVRPSFVLGGRAMEIVYDIEGEFDIRTIQEYHS